MTKFKLIYLLFVALIVSNCKSSRTIGSSGDTNFNLSVKQLIKENTKRAPNFKTLVSKVKINYSKNNASKSTSVSFRMEKDKTIWLSKLGLVKVLITPERVAFYNKLDNTYFDGNYKYISDLLGTDLDFKKVQNLLFGEAIYNLKDDNYKLSADDDHYILQPKKQRVLFELFLLLDPSYFKIKSQQISQPQEFRHLQIDYLSHQEINNQILPELIKIIAVESNEETIINMEFKNVSLNENLRFPFKIPSGFKEIRL